MDRNSTIGLVLIGLIITIFSVMNQPSKKETKTTDKKESSTTNNRDTPHRQRYSRL